MIDQIVNQFYQHRDEEKAAQMTAYMKDQFAFLGIPKPLRANLQKDILKSWSKSQQIDWDFVKQVWSLSEREFQYLAIDYLLRMKKALQKEDVEHLQYLITSKSWWDTVDAIASHLLGKIYLLDRDQLQPTILAWAAADNLWLRRSAILFQLKYKENTDQELLAKIILLNRDSQEFFINKASGWALREYSKSNPHWVKSFFAQHQFHPLTVREGSKYCE